MPLYETVLIARNELTQQQVEAVADRVAEIVGAEGVGGTVRKREYWGLRGLAFRIKKNRKAHYMLLGLDCPASAEQEVARRLGLDEDVLRHMTIRVDAISDEPSAILARRGEERDRDRGFRGPRPSGRFSSGRRERGDDREEFRARGPREGEEDGPPRGGRGGRGGPVDDLEPPPGFGAGREE